MSTPFKLKNKKDFDFGNKGNIDFSKKTDYSPEAIKGRKKYKDEGITYTRGSDEEQEVIRRQWGDDVDPPVREEDKK